MARRGPRSGIGAYFFRLYVAAYFAIVGFALLGDINGKNVHRVAISGRASAIAATIIGAAVLLLTLSGYRAVALRPTPAETQLVVMSPLSRTTTLARATAFSATSLAIVGALGAIAVMLMSPTQFRGLGVARQVDYVAFGAGAAVLGLGAHLLAAERRARVPVLVLAALVATAAVDAVTGRTYSALTTAVESLRAGPTFLVVAVVWAAGIALIVVASRGAERLSMELVARGGDVAERATFAIAGNDLRSLLLLQRTIGVHAWRPRSLVHVNARFARRFPATGRALRGVARWRAGRWLIVLTTCAGASVLLSAAAPSVRTMGLAAALLWVMGLAVNEPFAQENDRADLLGMYPSPGTLEMHHICIGAGVALTLLVPFFVAAPWVHTAIALRVASAIAATSAATCAAAITYRRQWKQLVNPAMAAMDPYGTSGLVVAVKVVWPAAIAAVALLGIRTHSTVTTAEIGVSVFALTLLWLSQRGRG